MPRSRRLCMSLRERCGCGSAAVAPHSARPTIPRRRTMHPDNKQLAAYLDGALNEAEHATTRAHILTCAACAARLERLRDDARRIATLSSIPAPDVRTAVRAR